jgi:hypothetical protein
MPRRTAASSKAVRSLAPLDIIGILPAVRGGEENLLAKDAWTRPLRVEFPWWDAPSELPFLVDTVELIWDGDEDDPVARQAYDGSNYPDPPDDLWLEVPVEDLSEGVHTLAYRVTLSNNTQLRSVPVNVTIDKTAPLLATPSTPAFPPEILPPRELTAYYLEGADKVRANIPQYSTPKVGDVITWYWDPSASGATVGGSKTLTFEDYNQPLVIDIPGDWIREQGDGDRYVWYSVTDRVGNPPSGQSAAQKLSVKAQPVPRVLPPPKVVEIGGTNWPAKGTLNPVNATNGVRVILNPASIIYYPDEVPRVRWASEGELGHYLADPDAGGTGEYKIPKAFMAAHFGKTIPVTYFFNDKHGQPHVSETFELSVLNYPNTNLQSPQIEEGSPLSLSAVPAEGASVILRAWPFIAAGQRITIIVEGLEDSSATTIQYQVLDRHEVTEAQVTAGIVKGQALIAKAGFLSRIRHGSQLAVKVYVSFDNGQTWSGAAAPNTAVAQFPWLRPRLEA